MQGVNSIVIGLPDCGKVCKNKHLPGFVERSSELTKAGFGQVIVASVTTPEKLNAFLHECGGVAKGIGSLADINGSFTRMLGLEINNPGTVPPYSQRYVGFVQDGALVRLVCFKHCGLIFMHIVRSASCRQ
jgi:glutaredoxin/glutathione-dependent peroxiredoxin